MPPDRWPGLTDALARVAEVFHETALWRVLRPHDRGGFDVTILESIEVFRAIVGP